jgi:predicted enzyme related to lactoylglutathione lyase
MESTICHFEIPADDLESARGFYGKLFGWTIEPAPNLAESYFFIRTSQQQDSVGGGILRRIDPQHGVTIYFAVAAIDEGVKTIEALGGTILVGKAAIPKLGWAVTARDPQGNTFGLFQEDPAAA